MTDRPSHSGHTFLRASLTPVHPGAFFYRRVLRDRDLSLSQAATHLEMAHNMMVRFVQGDAPVTDTLAAKLGKLCGTTAGFWTNMQAEYDGSIPQPQAKKIA